MAKKKKPAPEGEAQESPWKKALKAVRRARGKMTLAEAAEFLGVPLGTWISWEYGQRIPSRAAQTALRAKFPELKL